ncbi:MAG: glycosyltransferase family 87 protein [Planctomycetota bacterium]|nr:glycosyltransferase family 87 protein [Planctomycetota bacterium]
MSGLPRALPPTDRRVTWGLWVLVFVVLTIVAANGNDRGVTDVYEMAAKRWVDGESLYGGGYHGFLYAPPSAVVYVPFLYPEPIFGSFLWRLAGVALFATGLFRLARHGGRERSSIVFAVLTWLVLPVTLSSLRNGQSNLHLAGVLLHAAVELGRARRGATAAWLCAGWVFKPIVLVPMLLAIVHDRSLAWRLAVGTVVVALLPFLTASPGYVIEQYQAYGPKLTAAGDPGETVYTNIEGLVRVAGHPVPHPLRRPLQAVGALLALGLFWWARRRVPRQDVGILLCTVATSYLMLFNPRSEANSYVLVAPWMALAAAEAWVRGGSRVRAAALSAMCLGLGSDNYGRAFHRLTSKWFKPALVMLFLALTAPRWGRTTPGED